MLGRKWLLAPHWSPQRHWTVQLMNFGLVKSSKGWLIPGPVMIAQNVLYHIFPFRTHEQHARSMPFSPKHPVCVEERICWRKVSRATFTWTDGIQGLFWVETSWLTSQFFLDWGQFGRNMKIGQLNRSINTLYMFIWYTVIRYQLFDMLTSKSNPGNGWFISKQNNI